MGTVLMSFVVSIVRRLGHRPWFGPLARRLVWIDRALQRVSDGRFPPISTPVVPTLLLTTTGRRTGQPRSQPLAYVPDGDDFVVAASNFGGPRHPAWSANLLANPAATVRVHRTDVAVRAVLVTGAEADRLWALLDEHWPAYRTYRERTGRDIRLFRLARSG